MIVFLWLMAIFRRLAGSSPTRGGRLVADARDQQPFEPGEWGLESCSLRAFLREPPCRTCKKHPAGIWLQDYGCGSPDQNKQTKFSDDDAQTSSDDALRNIERTLPWKSNMVSNYEYVSKCSTLNLNHSDFNIGHVPMSHFILGSNTIINKFAMVLIRIWNECVAERCNC